MKTGRASAFRPRLLMGGRPGQTSKCMPPPARRSTSRPLESPETMAARIEQLNRRNRGMGKALGDRDRTIARLERENDDLQLILRLYQKLDGKPPTIENLLRVMSKTLIEKNWGVDASQYLVSVQMVEDADKPGHEKVRQLTFDDNRQIIRGNTLTRPIRRWLRTLTLSGPLQWIRLPWQITVPHFLYGELFRQNQQRDVATGEPFRFKGDLIAESRARLVRPPGFWGFFSLRYRLGQFLNFAAVRYSHSIEERYRDAAEHLLIPLMLRGRVRAVVYVALSGTNDRYNESLEQISALVERYVALVKVGSQNRSAISAATQVRYDYMKSVAKDFVFNRQASNAPAPILIGPSVTIQAAIAATPDQTTAFAQLLLGCLYPDLKIHDPAPPPPDGATPGDLVKLATAHRERTERALQTAYQQFANAYGEATDEAIFLTYLREGNLKDANVAMANFISGLNTPSEVHRGVARLVENGYLRDIFLLFPDPLYEAAMRERGLQADRDYRVHYLRNVTAPSAEAPADDVSGNLGSRLGPLRPALSALRNAVKQPSMPGILLIGDEVGDDIILDSLNDWVPKQRDTVRWIGTHLLPPPRSQSAERDARAKFLRLRDPVHSSFLKANFAAFFLELEGQIAEQEARRPS